MRLGEWRFSARLGWHNRFIKWMTIATAIVILAMTAFLAWRLVPEGLRASVLTLHYNVYLGIDDVRDWQWIFIVPGTMAAFVIVNLAIALGIFRKNVLAAKTLVAFSAALTVLWGIGTFFLVLVNL